MTSVKFHVVKADPPNVDSPTPWSIHEPYGWVLRDAASAVLARSKHNFQTAALAREDVREFRKRIPKTPIADGVMPLSELLPGWE